MLKLSPASMTVTGLRQTMTSPTVPPSSNTPAGNLIITSSSSNSGSNSGSNMSSGNMTSSNLTNLSPSHPAGLNALASPTSPSALLLAHQQHLLQQHQQHQQQQQQQQQAAALQLVSNEMC